MFSELIFLREKLMSLNVKYSEFAFHSDAYPVAVELRRKVLRAPLGLGWEPDAFEAEDRSFHFGAFVDGQLTATVILKPTEPQKIKMRQFAVSPEFQAKGIGSELLKHAEETAQKRGYALIFAHARESALPFYQRHGYAISGDPFTEVTITHRYISKWLSMA
jgi:GNAT superfamily N-acetyltransferase